MRSCVDNALRRLQREPGSVEENAAVQIRIYTPDDRTACLNIFRSNVPTYFAASDEMEFAPFIDDVRERFWVIDVDGQVRACGGLAVCYPEPEIATLCWGMVAQNLQRQGIGKALLEFRMREIATQWPSIRRVRITTTQVVQVFYERQGFAAVYVEPGGYGPGLDRVVMCQDVWRY